MRPTECPMPNVLNTTLQKTCPRLPPQTIFEVRNGRTAQTEPKTMKNPSQIEPKSISAPSSLPSSVFPWFWTPPGGFLAPSWRVLAAKMNQVGSQEAPNGASWPPGWAKLAAKKHPKSIKSRLENQSKSKCLLELDFVDFFIAFSDRRLRRRRRTNNWSVCAYRDSAKEPLKNDEQKYYRHPWRKMEIQKRP